MKVLQNQSRIDFLDNRYDYLPAFDDGPDGEWMVTKMKLTDDGFLKGRAIATNVGVFPYLLEDGTVQYELRSSEEVFDRDSRDSLDGVPLTNDHPSVKVTSENAKELSVGFNGNVRQDQYYLSTELTITDKQAVEDVQGGKRALSMGYTTDVIMESGVWMGVHYDAIQTKIRYNHEAIVPKGRAGDAARMKLDSMNTDGIQIIDKTDNRRSSMKFTFDGMEYEVDNADFVKLFKEQNKELEKLKSDSTEELKTVQDKLDTLQAKHDQLDEDNKSLKKDADDLKKVDKEKEINEAVKEKLDLMIVAEKLDVEVKVDMSSKDIKKAVILKKAPTAKLDEATDVYLNARFDAVVESMDETSGNEAFKGDSLKNKKKPEGKPDEEKYDSNAAHKKMIEEMANRSKRKEN